MKTLDHRRSLIIEHQFARLLEQPSGQTSKGYTTFHADNFDRGDTHAMGKLLLLASEKLLERAKRLTLTDTDREPDSAYGWILSGAEGLGELGDMLLSEPQQREGVTYHWQVAGCLASALDGALHKLGV